MDDARPLTEVQQLLGLKARYFRYIYTKQLDQLEIVFVRDAQMTAPSASFAAEEHEAIVVAIRNCARWHLVNGGPAEVSAGGPADTLCDYGHYTEEYVKHQGASSIQRLHLSRLHREVTSHVSDSHTQESKGPSIALVDEAHSVAAASMQPAAHDV